MSLDSVNVVDAVGLEKSTGTVVLSILDAMDWLDTYSHLAALQEKLNAYFGFIETGQIFESYPDARGRKLRIDVICRYAMPETGLSLIAKASEVASPLGVTVISKVHSAV